MSKSGSDVYNILALVSDQEAAILDFKTQVIEILGEGYNIKPEASPKEEHRANGTIERCIRDIAGTGRIIKGQLEHDYSMQLDSTHVVILWLVKYSGVLITLYCVSADGRT